MGGKTPEYIGAEKCMICHLPHYDAWNETKMAKAFEILKPSARKEAKLKVEFDPEEDYTESDYCLSCHVTGYDEPGGFVSFEETPKLVGVQCEACHGPGSIYAGMMGKKKGTFIRIEFMEEGGLKLPSEKDNDCAEKCHNDASPFVDPEKAFDYKERAARGVHKLSHPDVKKITMPFNL